jgi:hypothetical protein
MDKELSGYDKNGNPIYWDPRPRVVPLGDGKYAFKWFGVSGRELTLIYHRPDAVDVVVEASASSTPNGSIRYLYKIGNLQTSKQNLGAFVLQTFSPPAKPETLPGFYATDPAYRRSDLPPEERFGFTFSPLGEKNAIRPGQEGVLRVTSVDLPGLVQCSAHAGTLTMEGVGEEPPEVFRPLMLGRDAWPHGYTIGPDERLAKMGLQGRLNYLIIRLPQMLELGWIENEKVMQWYKDNLKPAKAAEVRARAKADFDKKLITSEVLALMTYLTQ